VIDATQRRPMENGDFTMKRLLLATTAVLTLAAPVMAQSDVEMAVSDALMTRGYSAEGIASLTNSQITELYLALTSEDESQIQTIIAGFGLPQDTASDVFADTGGQEQIRAAVADVLAQAGYPAKAIDMLSSEQITQIYISATSEDEGQLAMTLEAIGVDDMTASSGNAVETDAGMFVSTELERRGLDAATIEGLTDAEVSELYLALTSGDETAIRDAIASATSS